MSGNKEQIKMYECKVCNQIIPLEFIRVHECLVSFFEKVTPATEKKQQHIQEYSDNNKNTKEDENKSKKVKSSKKFGTVNDLFKGSSKNDVDEALVYSKEFFTKDNDLSQRSDSTDSDQYEYTHAAQKKNYSNQDNSEDMDLDWGDNEEFRRDFNDEYEDDDSDINILETIKRRNAQLFDQPESPKDYLKEARKANEEFEELLKQVEGVKTKKSHPNTIWNHDSVMDMLYEYRKLFRQSNGITRNLYKKIAECLKEKGYQFNDDQIKRKYLSLFDKYKKIKINNDSSGHDAQDFPYYEIFESMHSKNANVVPVSAVSSINPVPKKVSCTKTSNNDLPKPSTSADPDENTPQDDSRPSQSGSTHKKRSMEELQSKKVKVRRSKNDNEALVEAVNKSTESLKESIQKSNDHLVGTFSNILQNMSLTFSKLVENTGNKN